MSSSRQSNKDFLLDKFLISFSGTIAVAFYPSCQQEGAAEPLAAVFKVSNGLILATLDTSRQIKPSDVKKAERLVSNLVAGFEPDLGFEPISDEIYEASGSKVVFLLIQRHYPLLKKGALSWLVDKAIFRAKLAEKKARAADEQFNSSRPEICSTLLDQDSQQIADISSTAKITQEESSYIPKGSIRMRLN